MNRIEESLYRISGVELTEARNHENDEVNAIIRKHLWKSSTISKKDQEILDNYGIYRDEESNFVGPNGKKLYKYHKNWQGPERPVDKDYGRGKDLYSTKGLMNNDKIDLANYLTKNTPGEGKTPYHNDKYYNKTKHQQWLKDNGNSQDKNLKNQHELIPPSEEKALHPYVQKDPFSGKLKKKK